METTVVVGVLSFCISQITIYFFRRVFCILWIQEKNRKKEILSLSISISLCLFEKNREEAAIDADKKVAFISPREYLWKLDYRNRLHCVGIGNSIHPLVLLLLISKCAKKWIFFVSFVSESKSYDNGHHFLEPFSFRWCTRSTAMWCVCVPSHRWNCSN